MGAGCLKVWGWLTTPCEVEGAARRGGWPIGFLTKTGVTGPPGVLLMVKSVLMKSVWLTFFGFDNDSFQFCANALLLSVSDGFDADVDGAVRRSCLIN